MILKFLKNNFWLILAVALASLLRILWLNSVPPGIGGDELVYIINAKFILLKWSDIAGTWNPLSIFVFHYPYGQFQAELPYFLLLPFFNFLPLIEGAKFSYALLSIFTIPVIYLLTEELFYRKTAVIAAFIAAINPWFIFIGRTAYESVPATFFYLLSFLILIKAKNWKILWSIPFLVLSFYSNIETKLIFFPLVLIILIYVFYRNKKRFLKQYLIIGLLSFLLTLFFSLAIKNNPSYPRLSEIFTIGNPRISQIVNQTRKMTIETPLTSILENKATVYLGLLTSKLFNSISPSYLFLTGDNFYGLYDHGLLYPIDALFLVFGIIFIFIKDKKKFSFLILLTLLALVPHVLHGASISNFTPHLVLLFPILIIFIAVGIDGILKMADYKFTPVLIVALYVFAFMNFFNTYFYQYPLRGAFDFRLRLLSRYIALASLKGKVTFYSPSVEDAFTKYIFYTNNINRNTTDKISGAFKNHDYRLGNTRFTSCAKPDLTKGLSIIDAECRDYGKDIRHISIADVSDGFQAFRIYNDTVCKNITLNPYPIGIKLSDFSVEDLSADVFCKTFVTAD